MLRGKRPRVGSSSGGPSRDPAEEADRASSDESAPHGSTAGGMQGRDIGGRSRARGASSGT